MSVKILAKQRKYILLYSLIIFLVLIFLYILTSLTLNINIEEVKRTEIVKTEEKLVKTEKNIISNRIDRIISDTLYIADTLTKNGFDIDNFSNVENEWKIFSNRKKVYDQIRYVDLDGNEKIRINYSENGAVIVSKEQLQNKKDRAYFKGTIKLNKEQIYISNIDLNIEKGKVEEPIKPMVRIGTPVFEKNGELKGIVIVNYYVKNILKQVEDIASTSAGNIVMIDSNGNWIYNNKNKDKEWSFMYEETKNISFKNEFPNEFDVIKENKAGTILTRNGFFNYRSVMDKIDEDSEVMKVDTNSIFLGEGDWTVVSFIPKESEYGRIFFTDLHQKVIYILENNKLLFLYIFAISIILSILFTINKISNEEVKYFSEYDTMTGTFNRRAGFEKLTKMYMNIKNNSGILSICFIDINGLKQVNDNLGHESGDELILSIITIVKKNIRSSDFVARLGGDEFLIVFDNTNKEKAEEVWVRIVGDFKKINETEDRKYIISVSHGIEEFKCEINQSIDEIINLADEKMYNEKKIIKKDLQIIKKI